MWPVSRSFQNGLFLAFLILISEISASPVTLLEKPESTEPTPISVKPSFVANVFQNTHTSTIGPNGYATSVPIVGGPECWFCPYEDKNKNTTGGWALLGIPGPGTYQPLPISDGILKSIPVITISSNGDPVYTPSQTADELATKVKRGDVPIVVKTESYKIFESTTPEGVGPFPDYPFALRVQKTEPESHLGIEIPSHYALIVGRVRRSTTQSWDECSEMVIETVTYDIISEFFDMYYSRRTNACFLDNHPYPDGPDDWTWKGYDYLWMGRVKDVPPEQIKHAANKIIARWNKKGGYSLTRGRNCREFVSKLWKKIKG